MGNIQFREYFRVGGGAGVVGAIVVGDDEGGGISKVVLDGGKKNDFG